jgi:hypothetical protein
MTSFIQDQVNTINSTLKARQVFRWASKARKMRRDDVVSYEQSMTNSIQNALSNLETQRWCDREVALQGAEYNVLTAVVPLLSSNIHKESYMAVRALYAIESLMCLEWYGPLCIIETAVPHLVKNMTSTDTDEAEICLMALRTICMKQPEAKQRCIDLGIIPQIKKNLERTNLVVLSRTLQLMLTLQLNFPAARAEYVGGGIVPSLVALLATPHPVPARLLADVKFSVLSIIQSTMAASNIYNDVFISAGIIPVLERMYSASEPGWGYNNRLIIESIRHLQSV